MPRPGRICIPGMPHHIVQRGNNKQATFYRDDDFLTYLKFLSDATAEHQTDTHAYVLMTNHVHLLLSPTGSDGLSLVMQAVGRRYVTYINKTYGRTGTLWEGRFKGSVVDTEKYCLACYRYIDLNPLRAGMVKDPAAYRWSSYRCNGLGELNSLLTPHPAYLQLGASKQDRRARYRTLISETMDEESIRQIRYAARKGLPVGSDRFIVDIENYLGRRLGTGCVGRPRRG